MKHKLMAIIDNPCDSDIKAELLEELVKMCCEEYLSFSAERNDMLVSALGLEGFIEDIHSVSKKEIFEKFKDHLSEKYKTHIV